jgi:trehalose/maltose hydrolase-like predicted phosphorylase
MIHGVTGPNEYENNINNNWYTNTLAAWVLRYTTESLAKHSRADLNVTADELAKWSEIVDKMYYPFDEKEGVFVQHDGLWIKTSAQFQPWTRQIYHSTKIGLGIKFCAHHLSNKLMCYKGFTSLVTNSH